MSTERAMRLFPPPAEEIVGGVYADFDSNISDIESPEGRPYTIINMVSSVDGKSTIGGRAGGISGDADRMAMRNLRAWSDAVMIGAGTLRAEKLSLGVPGHLAKHRGAMGKPPQPLAVILSASGDIPLGNLVDSSQERPLLISSDKATRCLPDHVVRSFSLPVGEDGDLDLESVVACLSSTFHINSLLVEGGPSLNRSLIDLGLVDEFLITISPRISGGPRDSYLTAVEGTLVRDTDSLILTSVHLSDDHLFLRYASHTD